MAPKRYAFGDSLERTLKLIFPVGETSFPLGYFSSLNVEELKELRNDWFNEMKEIEQVYYSLLNNKPQAEEISSGELKDKIKNINSILTQIDVQIGAYEGLAGIDFFKPEEKVVNIQRIRKDPILEDILRKMNYVPQGQVIPVQKPERERRVPDFSKEEYTFFTQDQIAEIGKLFEHKNVEIEASFGIYRKDKDKTTFISGVQSGIYFSNLLSRLMAIKGADETGKLVIDYYDTIAETKTGKNGENIRRVINLQEEGEEWERKIRYKEKVENKTWGIRVSKSKEEYILSGSERAGIVLKDYGIDLNDWRPETTRFRKRTSFIESSSNGEFYGVRIDMSVVRTVNHEKGYEYSSYEVEVEKRQDIEISPSDFVQILKKLYRWMMGDYSVIITVLESQSVKYSPVTNVFWNSDTRLWTDKNGEYVFTADKKAFGKRLSHKLKMLTRNEREELSYVGVPYIVVTKEELFNRLNDQTKKYMQKYPDKELEKGREYNKEFNVINEGKYLVSIHGKIYGKIERDIIPLSIDDISKLKNMNFEVISGLNEQEVSNLVKETDELTVRDRLFDEVKLPAKKGEIVEKGLLWNPTHLMALSERRSVAAYHNSLFNRDINSSRKKMKSYQIWSSYWNKPVNLKFRNILNKKASWAVTSKYDGIRFSLLITEYGTYMVNPPYTLIYMGRGVKELDGTLLDGEFMSTLNRYTNEYIKASYWSFDILFHKKEDVRNNWFVDRLNTLKQVVNYISSNYKSDFPYLKIKQFEMIEERAEHPSSLTEKNILGGNYLFKNININDLYSNVKRLNKINDTSEEKTDGLIFQPYHWYKNNYTFKWKPPTQLTIDFFLQSMNKQEVESLGKEYEEGAFYYRTLVGSERSGSLVPFTGTTRYPYDGYIIMDSNDIDSEDGTYKEPIGGRVVECEWRKMQIDNEVFHDFWPIKIRVDRTQPNNLKPAIDVWEDINNPITRTTIEGDNLKIMRKYHNEYKFKLLKSCFESGSTILDIGSGRGGDISKWSSLKMKKVYAMEPDKETGESLKEFEERLKKDREAVERYALTNSSIENVNIEYPEVNILKYGAEETSKINNELVKNKDYLNGIVAFFSLTFFAKSTEMLSSLLKTIDLLPPGGKFVGIVLSGQKVKSLLRTESEYNSGEDIQREFKCTAFSVKQKGRFFDQRDKEKIIENEISTSVVGDKIEIDLRGEDPDDTTMVKQQTEWLFYFNYFKDKLKEMGFKVIRNEITESFNKDDEFRKLPLDSQIFSNLNQIFIFEKKKEKRVTFAETVLKSLEPYEKNKEGENINIRIKDVNHVVNRVGVYQSNTSFVNAVVQAHYTSNIYNKEEMTNKVNDLRKDFAKRLNIQHFKQLADGKVFNILKEDVIREAQRRGKKIDFSVDDKAFEKFKERLLNLPTSGSPGDWIGELEMTEYLAVKFNVNIYVVNMSAISDGYVTVTPSNHFARYCKHSKGIYSHNKSIVIFVQNGRDFTLLKPTNSKRCVFEENNGLVADIHNNICQNQ